MATINATLRTDKKADKYGRYPIYIRVSHQGKTKYFSVGASVQPEAWSKRTQSVKKVEIAGEINKQIDKLIESIEDQIDQQVHSSGYIDVGSINTKGEITDKKYFFVYAQDYINSIKKYSTRENYKTSFNVFKEFAENDILIDKINTPLIRRFKNWLEETNRKGSTINAHITNIKNIYQDAAHNGYLEDPGYNPFWAVPKAKSRTDRQYLTLEELNIFTETEIPKRLEVYRDTWLLSFWLAGARRIDLLSLQTSDIDFENGIIEYVMRKTGETVRLALLPEAEQIIRKYMVLGTYVLPFFRDKYVATEEEQIKAARNVSAKIKNNLAKVLEICGIDKHLTLHSARHTWSTLTRKYTDLSMSAIQSMLAHQSGNTTDKYIHRLDPYSENPKNMRTVHESLKKAK